MKYTDEEIINKFSKVDFDKTGCKKQAIFNKVAQKCAGKGDNLMKKYHLLIAAAAIILVAVPALMMTSGIKYGNITAKNDIPNEQTTAPQQVKQDTKAPAQAGKIQTGNAEVQTVEESAPAVPSYDNMDLAEAKSTGSAASSQTQKEMPLTVENERAARQAREQALRENLMRQEAAIMSSERKAYAKGGSTHRLSAVRASGAAMNSFAYDGEHMARSPRHITRLSAAPIYEPQLSQDTKAYNENGFKKAALEPLSTFSADVDTASYNMLKEQINRGWKIQKEGVRTEAIINNFAYNYPQPQGNDPIGINIEYAPAPWNNNNQLVRIGVKAKDINKKDLPQSNLVFLIDVSGSMRSDNRLPLVKQAFKMLLEQLDKNDIVSIVTYASGVNVRLDGARVQDKQKIIEVIDSLRASGATSGEEGLKRAYETAKKNYLRKGNNRIIIASDGDFNVGNSTVQALEKQVSDAKESGVFISALGFGMGNYRDNMMETIADKGNGNYAYINDLKAAQKALVREFGGTMFTVAKDVKFQVEFNPANVEEYRLIGYEKRLLNNEDFNDDKKDAGEVGAGHSVTVLYEIRPKGGAEKQDIDPLKYAKTEYISTDEVLTVKMRYKDPDGDNSKLISKTLKKNDLKAFDKASEDFRFASAAAAFGQLVKDGQYLNGFTANQIADIASKAKGIDDSGDRAEFVQIIRTYAATPKQDEPQTYNGYDPIHPEPDMIIYVK